jgi:hypothetical protein
MRAATVALIVKKRADTTDLIEVLSDEREIDVYESEQLRNNPDPLARVHEYRAKQIEEDDAFADYVEELLSQPFQKEEIKEHGIQWLRSKQRIEDFQKNENEAAVVIAKFALDLFTKDPEKNDFYLSGPTAQVRVRIFVTPQNNFISDVA